MPQRWAAISQGPPPPCQRKEVLNFVKLSELRFSFGSFFSSSPGAGIYVSGNGNARQILRFPVWLIYYIILLTFFIQTLDATLILGSFLDECFRNSLEKEIFNFQHHRISQFENTDMLPYGNIGGMQSVNSPI